MSKELDLINGLVVGPNEWRGLAHKHIEDLSDPKKRGSGILSGSQNLDKLLNPLKDAQMRVVMSRPGGGKTSFLMQQTREAAKDWYLSGDTTRTPPVFISAEMAIEEIVLREVSNYIPVDSMILERGEVDDWKAVHTAVDEIAERRPIIFVGHSLDIGRKRPRISVENIRLCIQNIQDQWSARPYLVSVDYAQRLKLDKATRDRRGEVSEIVESIKDMALEFATPINLGSQVGRQVDERKPPIPSLADAKETSNLEETADSILAFMRPSRYYKVGEKIPGSEMDCHENLFRVEVLKQRQGRTGGCWLWFDMSISRLSDIEIERVDLNNWEN